MNDLDTYTNRIYLITVATYDFLSLPIFNILCWIWSNIMDQIKYCYKTVQILMFPV